MTSGPDPERWTATEGAPESLRTAIRAARTDGPDAAELAAIAGALGPRLGTTGGAGGASPGPGVGGALRRGQQVRWMIAAAAIGAGGLLAVLATRRSSEQPVPAPSQPAVSATHALSEPATSEQPPAAEPEESAPEPVAAPQPSAAPQERTNDSPARPPQATERERSPVPAASASSSSSTVSRPSEAALLDSARAALRTDPRRALGYTQTHRSLYPNGLLAQEREVIAIEALRRIGDSDGAADRSRAFENEYPESIHGREVETPAGEKKKQ